MGCRASRGRARRPRRRCASNASCTSSGVRSPPEMMHRDRQRLDQLAGRSWSGGPLWRWEAWRGCRQIPATAPSCASRCASSRPQAVPGAQPRAQLDGHRQAAPAGRRPGERDRAVGIVEQCRSRPGLAHLRHRAAHVEVDQVGAGGRHALGGRCHHLGIVTEQLHRDRVLVGMDPQQLACRCARCRSARRSSRPSRRRPARRRGVWPAGARTSCRFRPAARARRGWRAAPRRGVQRVGQMARR